MDTQGHTSDKLLTMKLLTVVLPARVLRPSTVLFIMELRGTHVRHDIIWQTVLFLQCTHVGSAAGPPNALTLSLGRGQGDQLPSLTVPCQMWPWRAAKLTLTERGALTAEDYMSDCREDPQA